jgi:hypothetical protein
MQRGQSANFVGACCTNVPFHALSEYPREKLHGNRIKYACSRPGVDLLRSRDLPCRAGDDSILARQSATRRLVGSRPDCMQLVQVAHSSLLRIDSHDC